MKTRSKNHILENDNANVITAKNNLKQRKNINKNANHKNIHQHKSSTTTAPKMYITQEQLQGFSSYKYNCIDNSPLSIYVMHPFWNYCVQFVPKSIAPNLLTLTGFFFTVFQFIVLSTYDPTFNAQTASRLSEGRDGQVSKRDIGKGGLPGEAIPMEIWFFCAFCQFMAHTLDGIDGKQARRIGLTGPLGELMDHGIDAWSCSFIAMSVFSTIGVASDKDPMNGLTMIDMVSRILNFKI